MIRYAFLIVLALVLPLAAQPLLEPEAHFFGMPNVTCLSTGWFLQHSDTTDPGLRYPADMELLKLTPSDYRLLLLDRRGNQILSLRLNQKAGLSWHSVTHTDLSPDTSTHIPVALCRMQTDAAYFDPATDRLAVAFEAGVTATIYRFDPDSNRVYPERDLSSADIYQPVGLFYAFNQFFIPDDSTQQIVRLDALGNTLSRYGCYGLFEDGYAWISDITGYVDFNQTAHLYVSDGALRRVDHLTATASDSLLHLESQAWRTEADADSGNYEIMSSACIPYLGVVGLDRNPKRLYFWSGADSLSTVPRTASEWPNPLSIPINVWQVGGRLVIASLDSAEIMWALHSYPIAGIIAENPYPPTLIQWTADMSPLSFTESYHVIKGDTLLIEAGVHVLFDSAAALVVDSGAVLMVNGTAQNPVVFDAASSGQTWRGLRVNSPSPSNHLRHATLAHATSGIEVWNGALDLTATTLDPCAAYGAVYANSYGAWHGSAVKNCGRQGALFICSHVTLDSCEVAGNTRAGLRLVGGDYALRASRVRGNRCGADTLRHPGAGLELFGAHLDARCDTLADNDGPGLFAFAGAYARLVHGWNRILDNQMAYQPGRLDLGQIGLMGGSVQLGDGFNTIAEPRCALPPCNLRIRNLLIDSAAADLARNDWGAVDPELLPSLLPPQAVFDPTLPGPLACGVLPEDTSGAPLDVALFNQAWSEELQSQFTAAIADYDRLIKDFPESEWVSAALDRIYFCQEKDGKSWATIREYFSDLAASDSLTDALRLRCRATAAWCYVGMGEFEDAEAELHDLLDPQSSEFEQLEIQLKVLMEELLALQNDSLLESLAGQHPDKMPRRAVSRRDTALVAFCQNLDNLLAAQLSRYAVKGAPAPAAALPTRYALYQNYPNPFNPVTEIRFDLPEAVDVQLKIFNLLGQEVITLIDTRKPAGAHSVAWDSKSAAGLPVSSGTYVYRLKAGHFVASKKLTLLK